MIGQEIGNYKIIDIIGKGGMAVVYLGQHKALTRRTVAIKMLSASLEGDFAFNERFFREAEVMDRLDHPNVVTLYDFIEHEGRYFIVMEYISGKTLAHLIQERGGPLPLEEVSVIFKQVFDAIAYAHDLGIVQRDLKPSNIMIDEKMTDQYEKALAKAQEALTIAPENKDAKLIKSLALKAKRAKEVQDLLLKAEVAFASGRYEEAIEAAGDALKIDPDNPKAGDLLGRAKVKLEEQERAKKALALKLDEAEALLESKAYTKASQVAKEVLSKDPQNSKAKAILAKARRGQRHKLTEAKLTEARSLIRAGKIQAALAKLDEVLKLNPKHPEAKRLKQDLVAKLNSKPNKQKEIERRLALAEDLIAAEQYERARIVIEKILDQDPDNKRAQDLLEMAQEGQKRKLLKQFLPPILPGANPQDIGIPGMGTPGQ